MKIDSVHAEFLSGNAVSTTVSTHSIVSRDGNGGVWATKLNSTNLALSHNATARTSDTIFYSSDDDIVRKNTAAGMRASLSLENSAMIPASSTNLASNIVVRDASGNFSAGVIEADGSKISSLNASNLATGTVHSDRLSLSASDIPTLNQDTTGNAATASSCSGNSATATNADKLDGVHLDDIFNNMGGAHSNRSDFDSVPDAGCYYITGNTNGPGVNSATQYYGFTLGLGGHDPVAEGTSNGKYGCQLYWGRNVSNPYINVRYLENGTWGSWNKASAGYADSAGYATSAGSAGNADTVDNLHAGSFLRSDADDTVGAGVTYTWSATNTHGLKFVNASYSAYSLQIGGWTSSNDNNISRIRNSSGNLHIDSAANGNLYLNHYSSGTLYITTNTYNSGTFESDGRIYADNGVHVRGDWLRVNGNNGLYFESHGGGWFMQDTTWVRVYNGKSLWCGNGIMGTNYRCGIGTSSPDERLHVYNNSTTARAIIERDTNSGECNLTLKGYHSSGSTEWQIYHSGSTAHLYFWRGGNRGYLQYAGSNYVLNFTGQHRTFIKDIPFTQAPDLEGLIVSADQNKYIKMSGGIEAGSNAITTNESLPVVTISTKANDKKCFGVISASEDPETREEAFGNFVSVSQKEYGDTRVFINSVGEGAIWVTNINGNLESGDYITTSNVTGYGMLQDDDILHNYTVAKITMDCDFEPVTQPVQQIVKELSNVNYWVKTTYRDVALERYSNLTEENRQTITTTRYSNEEGEISPGEYSNLESNVQATYSEIETTAYQQIERTESKTEKEGYTLEVREELVNVLDEHGQLQWEDHPTDTEKAYKIRYLTSDGQITDEANAVHIAAFVGCTYHCG